MTRVRQAQVVRRPWRALSAVEQQERLERLRRQQHQQVLRDARALRVPGG